MIATNIVYPLRKTREEAVVTVALLSRQMLSSKLSVRAGRLQDRGQTAIIAVYCPVQSLRYPLFRYCRHPWNPNLQSTPLRVQVLICIQSLIS